MSNNNKELKVSLGGLPNGIIFSNNQKIKSLDLSNEIGKSDLGGNYEKLYNLTVEVQRTGPIKESFDLKTEYNPQNEFITKILSKNALKTLTIVKNSPTEIERLIPQMFYGLSGLEIFKLIDNTTYNSESNNIFGLQIGFKAFFNLPQLKEIYLPEKILGDIDETGKLIKRLGDSCFYANSPKNIYICINGTDKTGKTIQQLVENEKNLDYYAEQIYTAELFSQDSPQTVFPYNSNLYLYDLSANSSKYKSVYIGKYKGAKPRSNKYIDMELNTYQELETWGNLLNNDNNEIDINNQ